MTTRYPLVLNGTSIQELQSSDSLVLPSALATGSGGTGLTSFTTNGVVYASSTSALATGSNLVFNGTQLGIGGTPSYSLDVYGSIQSRSGSVIADTVVNYGSSLTLNSAGSLPMLFQINGSERMRLNTSGYLGIGTNSPSGLLDVLAGSGSGLTALMRGGTYSAPAYATGFRFLAPSGSSNVNRQVRFTSSAGQLTIQGVDGSGTDTSDTQIILQPSGGYVGIGTTSPTARLDVYDSASASTADLFIVRDYLGGGSDKTRLIVKNGGNVGIGTSSPNRLLSLYATQPVFQITNVASGNTQGTIQYQVSGSTDFILDNQGSGSGGNIIFYQAGTLRMQIDTSGNLGLGVTPSAWRTDYSLRALQVGPVAAISSLTAGTTNNQTFFSSNLVFGSGGTYSRIYADWGMQYEQTSGQHLWFTTSTQTGSVLLSQLMTLDSSGNLGVGTTSPGARIDAEVSSGNGYRAYKSTTGGFTAYRLYTSNENVIGTIGVTSTNDTFYLGYTSTPVLTWNSSGNVGIGTSSPSAKLAVRSDITGGSATVRLRGTDTTARLTRLQLEDYTGAMADGLIDFVVPTAGTASSALLKIGVNSPMLTINYNGAVSLSGAVTNASGVGITFPATQSPSSDVNTLDDYEEGSWTPNFAFTSGGPAFTAGNTSGQYIKVGRQVTCWFFINCTSLNGGSGQAFVIGLPFTSGNVPGALEGATMTPNYWGNFASAVIPGGYVQNNSVQVLMINTTAGTGISAITAASMTSTPNLYACFTYLTAN